MILSYISFKRGFEMSDHTKHSAGYERRKKIRKWTCTVLLVIILGALYGCGAYAYSMLNTAHKTITKTYREVRIKKARNVSKVLNEKKPISILLLGTDTGDLGRDDTGRTDTLIIATVNPATQRTTLTSIPRDTLLKIPGCSDSYDKINAAYSVGGVPMAIKSVQKLLDVPIDYYVLINMGGLRQIVDAIGGITITPTLTFQYEDANVVEGQKTELDGKAALSYARMRHDDPLQDYGRQKRQRQVIQALAKKALTFSNVSKFDDILDAVKDNMKTDLSYDDMWALETNYKKSAANIKSDCLQGKNGMYDGTSYQIATTEERSRISKKVRSELGLEESTETFTDDTGIADAAMENARALGQ